VVLDYGAQLKLLAASALAYRELTEGGGSSSSSSSSTSAEAAAQRLFQSLRWAESVPGAASVLLADPRAVDASEGAEAVRDRLWRAASGKMLMLEGGGL
jgi:hypothetical protein